MKATTIVLILIILLILGGIYFYVKMAINRVSFQIGLKGFDLSGISISDVFQGTGAIKLQALAKISNRNNFAINLSKFKIWMYYQGTMIAQTTDETNNISDVSIPANGNIDVTHDVTVYLNSAFLQAIKDLRNGANLKFDYTTSFRVYGIPFTYKDYFNYKL